MARNSDKSSSYSKSDAAEAASDAGPILGSGIGRRISEAASALGTRKSAHAVMQVSSAALQRYIAEENMPPFDAVARLCLAAGVRLEWLATGEGDMRSQAAPGGASQPLRRDDLTMALQLASEALGEKELPPAKHAELVTLIYELLEEGLPEAKVLRFARAAAA